MNSEGDPCCPSTPANPTVDTVDQDPGTQLHIPGLVGRRKPGRPSGSKNKAKAKIPSIEGLGLRNRTVFVPWSEIDISDSSEDDKNDFKDIHDNGSEWEGDDSDFESKGESKFISEQRQAYRQGVQHMTQLIQERGPSTDRSIGSKQHFSSPARRRTTVWNQAKEDDLNNRWERSLERAAIERYSEGAHSLLATWNMSLHLFGINPLALISMYRHTTFDNTASDCFEHHGEIKQNPLWTRDFCRKLTRIMVHPLFVNDNDHRFIPIFIRWAVICRADDGHGFTEMEQQLLDDVHCGSFRPSDSKESMVERFQDYQQKRKDDDRIISRHAQLMFRIVEHSKTIKRESLESFAPVKIRDLTVIVDALDSLERYTTNTTCETYFLVYSACEKPPVQPKGLHELLEAYKTSWISLQRREMPDYTHIGLTTTPNHQTNAAGAAIEGPGKHNTDQTDCSPGSAVDCRGGTASEANDPPPKSDEYPSHDHQSTRSPSELGYCKVLGNAEASISSPADAGIDHLHESRRFLIRIDQHSKSLAHESVKPRDITQTQPSESDIDFYQELDKLLVSCPATQPEHTEPKAPVALMTLPRTRDPHRESTGFYDDLRTDDTVGEFRNVDELFNRRSGNRRTTTTTRPSGASYRVKDLATLSSRNRKRDSNRFQKEDYTKRRRFHESDWRQVERSDRRNSVNERRGDHRPQRSPSSQSQPPKGPRVWEFEQRYRRN
ncbi:hypothetical protein FPOAC2_08777 [Fusarium poae]|uniref:hypothetical protein n=1 Tax=Fusarium poae TaxID=36050 RepID=UPI001CE80337|nr:hypothetical protein FPOAC1_008842 [Fusarium poae]KAG8669447.1 hypothetical protein FPOAC1_008842 [Fusarium poae]